MELVTIGYFGVPGKMGHLTHLSDGKKPLCGTRLHPEAIYQWCLPSWRHGDPECERCKKIRLGWLIDFNEDKKPNIPVKKKKNVPPDPVPRVSTREVLLRRIQEYLELGGLFNPEMMEHDKVQRLITDCRDYLLTL